MNLLAIETSSDACSVALLCGTQIQTDHRIVPQQHGRLVLPMIDALMAQSELSVNQLDGVVFGRGPGSFTGVRIAVALTQGIALGADVGVIGISTINSIAQGVYRQHGDCSVAVSIDARMDEVYFAAYTLTDDGVMKPVTEEYLCPQRAFLLCLRTRTEAGQAQVHSATQICSVNNMQCLWSRLEKTCGQMPTI
jgi:tRNA threonylcarbamoyladenosine biosynthesis protein TsaB